jgi:hypothetical protein
MWHKSYSSVMKMRTPFHLWIKNGERKKDIKEKVICI